MTAEAQLAEAELTGNAYTDGLIFGAKWKGAITFSFPASASEYVPGYGQGEPLEGFQPVSPLVADAVRAIMTGEMAGDHPNLSAYGSFASIIAVDISEVSLDGDFRFAVSDNPERAHAYLPQPDEDDSAGDTWFGTANAGDDTVDFQAPYLGGYAWFATLHELGHAFGLKHADETDGISGTAVPADHDTIEFTLMSYRSYVGGELLYSNDYYDYPSTLMMEDIRALQSLYGADYSAAAHNRDTVYKWDPETGEMFLSERGGAFVGQGLRDGGPEADAAAKNRIFMTIWDGGGSDAYDLSNYSTDLKIDLQPGHWSVLSQAQLADLELREPGMIRAQGNVYNAYDFGNDGRGLIESAIGGTGNDSITGNTATNWLEGGAGDDSLDGGAGVDVLLGGAGADAMHGGDGVDTAFYGHATAGVMVIAGFGYTGEAAGDVLVGIENLSGTEYSDYLGGDNGNNHIQANTGSDTVFGFGGDDTILSGGDTDLVYGMDGNDSLEGGADATGVSLLFGDAGDDYIKGFGGRFLALPNYFAGGDGNDTILGSEGGDWLFGDMLDYTGTTGSGDDSIYGDRGDDQIFGGVGDDTIGGGSGTDVVYGGTGDDLLVEAGGSWDGGILSNILIGGEGEDTLEGGWNSDYLVGGSGADLFRIFDIAGADRVADFEVGIDKIAVFLAYGTTNGVPVTSTADLLSHLVTVGTSTVLVLSPTDTMELLNVAQISLTAGDFILLDHP